MGVNSYGILSGFLGIGSVTNSVPDSAQRIRDASESGLMAVRFWLDVAPSDYWFRLAYSKFSDSPSHQAYFLALDTFVSNARKNGVYLVPVLASAYDQWTRLGANENFWLVGSKANLKFKDWVQSIISRYANESQIAWWEVGNEPNYFARTGLSRADIGVLASWGADIYNFVKRIDSNHLVSGGFSNTGNLDPREFFLLNQPFDMASLHIYEKDLYALEEGRGIVDKEQAIRDYIRTYSILSQQLLHKPLAFGEFNGDGLTPSAWFVEKFLENASEYADVALVWSWEEGDPSHSYYVSPGTTPNTTQVLQQYASRFLGRPRFPPRFLCTCSRGFITAGLFRSWFPRPVLVIPRVDEKGGNSWVGFDQRQ